MSRPIRQGETVAARRFGPFDARDVAAYAAASGDDNPLHADPALAAKAGLAGVPIHGMLILGCFETFLRDWRAGVVVRKLSGKFIRPVLVDEAFDVSAKVVRAGAESTVLRLMVKRAGTDPELVCMAEAVVTEAVVTEAAVTEAEVADVASAEVASAEVVSADVVGTNASRGQ